MARVAHAAGHPVVVIAGVVICVAVERPPAHEVLERERRAADALEVESVHLRA